MITGPEGAYLYHPRNYIIGRVIAQAGAAWRSTTDASLAEYFTLKHLLAKHFGIHVWFGWTDQIVRRYP